MDGSVRWKYECVYHHAIPFSVRHDESVSNKMESRFWCIRYDPQTLIVEAEKIADILVRVMERSAVHQALGIVFEATYVVPTTNADGDDAWEAYVLLKLGEEITEEMLQHRLATVDRKYEHLFGDDCYCEAICEELFEGLRKSNDGLDR